MPRFFVATPHATGNTSPRRDRGLERRRDLVRVELLALEVALHQRLVRLDDRVEQLLAVLRGELGHLVGDRPGLAFLRALGARVGAHVQDVDDARSARARRRSGCARRRTAARAACGAARACGRSRRARGRACSRRRRARAESSSASSPRPRRADLDAHHAGDDDEHPLDDARGGAELALEARVAGDVDQVELPVLPGRVRRATSRSRAAACARPRRSRRPSCRPRPFRAG